MPRFPYLDGLRGYAILLVVAFHFTGRMQAEAPWEVPLFGFLHAGWIGVDLFFVLSGFLITRILLQMRETGGPLAVFYLRRARRIFPLYYALLAFVFLLLPLARGLRSPEMLEAARHQWWLWTYLANWAPVQWGFLGHLWSLSVEEQFYLFWPLLVLRTRPRTALMWCVGLLVCCPALRIALLNMGVSSDWIYRLTPCRLDGFAAGASVALWRALAGTSLRKVALWTFLCSLASCLALAIFRVDWKGSDPFVVTIGLTCIALGGAALLCLLLDDTQPRAVRWMFGNALVRRFGKYSYSIYLFHGFVILKFYGLIEAPANRLLARSSSHVLIALPALALILTACLAWGWVSWFAIESRFLQTGHSSSRVPFQRVSFRASFSARIMWSWRTLLHFCSDASR